jgi:hypothetical protein
MILIGLPIYQREWIIHEWFRCIENQTVPLSELGFIFELGDNDEGTHQALWDWHSAHPEVRVFDGVVRTDIKHRHHPEGMRIWPKEDFLKMSTLRNNLLKRVRCLEPERYFSLDSDILIEDPYTIEKLCRLTEIANAASPLCYMWPEGTDYPNMMSWYDHPGGRAQRPVNEYPIGTDFQSDIIMGAVMMSKAVYQSVDYRWHKQGEDLGWSAEATRHNFKLFSATSIYAPHIMHKEQLRLYKLHGDMRAPSLSL